MRWQEIPRAAPKRGRLKRIHMRNVGMMTTNGKIEVTSKDGRGER